jgi:hypothetical protein
MNKKESGEVTINEALILVMLQKMGGAGLLRESWERWT